MLSVDVLVSVFCLPTSFRIWELPSFQPTKIWRFLKGNNWEFAKCPRFAPGNKSACKSLCNVSASMTDASRSVKNWSNRLTFWSHCPIHSLPLNQDMIWNQCLLWDIYIFELLAKNSFAGSQRKAEILNFIEIKKSLSLNSVRHKVRIKSKIFGSACPSAICFCTWIHYISSARWAILPNSACKSLLPSKSSDCTAALHYKPCHAVGVGHLQPMGRATWPTLLCTEQYILGVGAVPCHISFLFTNITW